MKKITFILMAVVMISCKKEKEASSEELLVRAVWKMVAQSSQTSPTAAVVETFYLQPDCRQDDKYVFLEDHSFLQLEGDLRCLTTDPEVKSSSTWELSDDGKTLTLGSVNNNVTKISQDSLVINRISTGTTIITFRFTPY